MGTQTETGNGNDGLSRSQVVTPIATVRALPTGEPCECGGPGMMPHPIEYEVASIRGTQRVCSRSLVQACRELTI